MSHDPNGHRLPIKLDSTSNGEFVPRPLSPLHQQANQLAHAWAAHNARRCGLDRRRFLISTCGAATTLLAFNHAYASRGEPGGWFDLPEEAQLEPQLAAAQLTGKEFIFDIQGHFVNPQGRWINSVPEGRRPFAWAPKSKCVIPPQQQQQSRAYLQCLGQEAFIKDVFMDSDTDMMVLSFVPSHRDREPLTIEEADACRRLIDRLEGSQRLLLHGRVNPNQDGDLQGMDELAERWKVSAWKTYTQWGPKKRGFYLYEEPGLKLIEKARKLDVKVICIHKGIPFGRRSYEHSRCDDIGVVAKQYPDVDFIVYHSGFDPALPEGPFAPGQRRDGVDSLVQSLLDNNIPPNSNVYAELGSTWRFLMRDPTSAAHTLGKLLKFVGEDNLLWGTDSIWYGSPQDQIQAFRSFQIHERLREAHGYPKITPELRAKVFGLNATRPYKIQPAEVQQFFAKDRISAEKTTYRHHPNPNYLTYGPRTRREFLNLLRWRGINAG